MPIEPATEVLLLQPLDDDPVLHMHAGDVEAADAERAGAQVPLSLRLAPERTGHTSERSIERPDEVEDLAAVGDVDAERPAQMGAVLARGRPMVRERQDLLHEHARRIEPVRHGAIPERRHRPAHEAASMRVEASRGAVQPLRPHTRVVVGCGHDRAARFPNAGVERGVLAGRAFVDIAERRGESARERGDNRRCLIRGIVVDDEHFPVARVKPCDVFERVLKVRGAVVRADDDREAHGVGPGGRHRKSRAC